MSDTEKSIAVDSLSASDLGDCVVDPDAGLSAEERAVRERKLLWKLDLRLMPWLCLLYLICFLDRTNIGNAKIADLTEDIPMSNSMFNVTLTIFFISYAIFEPLANALLKRLRPSIFIPTIMFLWGCCMVGMGFVTNWSGLMAARWFLGVTEAGLFPGINYYLSCWYKRSEFGVRAAVFFSAAALSGSFGGLLAAAIQGMDGLRGLFGWQWIFIIEGIATVTIGLLSFLMIHDFPVEANFLSPEDKTRVLFRLQSDKQASARNEGFKLLYLRQAMTDWKTYCGMLIYMGPLMPLYSFSLFLPTIIQNMSFTDKDQVVKNQLLSVPPYAVAVVATIGVGLCSDRVQKRGIFNMVTALIGVVGFIMLIASTRPGVQYAGIFIAAAGIYPSVSLTIAWIANNVEGVYKRGIVLGVVIGWGNLNGVVSSNIYFRGPRFFEGHGTIIAYLVICIFGGSLLMTILLGRENRKRQKGERNYLVEGKTEQEIDLLGDERPDFVYTL